MCRSEAGGDALAKVQVARWGRSRGASCAKRSTARGESSRRSRVADNICFSRRGNTRGQGEGLGRSRGAKPHGGHDFWCLCCRQDASDAAFLAASGGERA